MLILSTVYENLKCSCYFWTPNLCVPVRQDTINEYHGVACILIPSELMSHVDLSGRQATFLLPGLKKGEEASYISAWEDRTYVKLPMSMRTLENAKRPRCMIISQNTNKTSNLLFLWSMTNFKISYIQTLYSSGIITFPEISLCYNLFIEQIAEWMSVQINGFTKQLASAQVYKLCHKLTLLSSKKKIAEVYYFGKNTTMYSFVYNRHHHSYPKDTCATLLTRSECAYVAW